VRRRIAAGESTEDLLLPAVANYIQSSGLYAPPR
jgi:nicotinic acid mononucleotide adenylyltransferase